MRTNSSLLHLSIFLLFIYSCNSKTANSNDYSNSELDKYCIVKIDSFFNEIRVSNYTNALDDLLRQNENIDLKDSGTVSLREQFKKINELSGKYIGYSLLKKKIVGDDVGAYSYLVKYSSKFYRFIFIFYNNGASVKIYKFKFDDSIDVDLEESLRLYL